MLEDPDPRVVANAVEGLAELGGNASEPSLRVASRHEHPRVRANALLALGLRGDADARTALEQWQRDATPVERESAQWAWHQLQSGGTP